MMADAVKCILVMSIAHIVVDHIEPTKLFSGQGEGVWYRTFLHLSSSSISAAKRLPHKLAERSLDLTPVPRPQ